MMFVEIIAGIAYGSMALLADGLHMVSHSAALGISAFDYIYARCHAGDDCYNFGTGKVNALAGFTSVVLLAIFALLMVRESVERFIKPVAITFDQAILVAIFGLAVKAKSALILKTPKKYSHDHGHGPNRADSEPSHRRTDHNLRAAFLHVLADALTSLLAIIALLVGKLFGLVQMNPIMGIVGAVMVARWSWVLLRDTGVILLDRQAPVKLRKVIRAAIEKSDDNRIADLHIWSIGPDIFASSISIVTDRR
jgi:cation diffusion facilitator family transporter